ncbi:MAG: NAD(+) synthase [Deltaproteobacteria bacterium]|nr:NAD(+) synthase [Deltaproteobacteria bacterium]
MRSIHVGVAALNQTPLAWANNRENVTSAIDEARSEGVRVLCLPELCLTGYGCEDMFQSLDVARRAARILTEEVAPRTTGMVVSVGLPVHHLGAVYNAAALCVDGRVVGLVAKQNLAGDGIHYEPRWFKPWPVGEVATFELGGVTVPIGDLVFDIDGVRLGFEICEDAWVAARPGGRLAARGVDVVLNPSASHFAFQKQKVRRRFVLEGSRAFGVAYLYANLLGNEAGRAIYDGGTMIAAEGVMLREGPRFSFAQFSMTAAVVDVDAMRMQRARLSSFKPEVAPEGEVNVPFSIPSAAAEGAPLVRPSWDSGPTHDEEEFTRAMALGLFDYMRKACSRGYVVSLSGGADSAACAVLIAQMVDQSVRELGLDAVRETLGHVPGIDEAADPRGLVGLLLTTAYQSTKNSGSVTRDAARRLAEALGCTHHELDVDDIVTSYVTKVEGALGRKLDWEHDDIALQNIQARVRSPSVWLFANIESKILVATANRSEAAVGYATMDGDTSGGLSPIAGIDKAFLRRWLRFMEEVGPTGGAPIPALDAVNVQAPTAELRPQGAGQTDEGDLMPYPLLDAIEDEAIGGKKPPAEVLLSVAAQFPEFDDDQLRLWVRRFFTLFSRNQWKRERYAPSFHVDDKNLDPKTWCRFPILSGGFREELQEMDDDE